MLGRGGRPRMPSASKDPGLASWNPLSGPVPRKGQRTALHRLPGGGKPTGPCPLCHAALSPRASPTLGKLLLAQAGAWRLLPSLPLSACRGQHGRLPCKSASVLWARGKGPVTGRQAGLPRAVLALPVLECHLPKSRDLMFLFALVPGTCPDTSRLRPMFVEIIAE